MILQTSEEDRARLMSVLAWRMRNTNPDRALKLAKSALALAEKHDQPNYMALSYNVLGHYHSYRNVIDSAIYYFYQEIAVAEQYQLIEYKVYAYQNLGNIHLRRSHYDSALYFYQQTRQLNAESGSLKSLATSQTNIGLIYFMKGEYADALDYYYDAYRIYKDSLESKAGFGAVLNNIGDVFLELHDYQKALSYYQESITISEQMKDHRRLCTGLRQSGKVRAILGDTVTAEQNFTRAIGYAQALNDPVAEVASVKERAIMLLNTGRTREARHFLQAYENMIAGLQNDAQKAEVRYIFGQASFKEKAYLEALAYLNKALKISEEKQSLRLQADVNKSLFLLCTELGKYQQANQHARRFITLTGQLGDESIVKVLSAYQKYEREKADKELAGVHLKIESQERASADQQKKLILVIAVLVGLVCLAVMWHFYMLFRERSARQLHLLREQVHQQKIKTMATEQEMKSIEARLEGEENERERLARDLHDGIGGSLGGLKLQLSGFHLRTEEVYQLEQMIDGVYQEVRMISRNLTSPAIRDHELTGLIRKYLEDLMSGDEVSLEIHCFPEEELNQLEDRIKTDLYRIIQELTTNIFKHAKASEISVQLTIHTGYINLLVEDNGIGFDVGSEIEGIGLINVSSRIRLWQGNLEISSLPGKGTIINIDIPYSKTQYNEQAN